MVLLWQFLNIKVMVVCHHLNITYVFLGGTMITTFWNNKGGVGKSTLAAHVAFRAIEKGRSITFVDADQQQNSISWLAGHEWDGEGYSSGSVTVTNDMAALSSGGDIVVDAPPAWDVARKLSATDLWIIPVNGRFSVAGAGYVVDQVKELRSSARIVLVANMADVGTKFGRYEVDEAKKLGCEIFKLTIPRHEVIRRAEMTGLPCWKVPYGTRATATQNILLLADWVLDGCQDRGTLGELAGRLKRYEV
jgi:chromosome partitioning protein